MKNLNIDMAKLFLMLILFAFGCEITDQNKINLRDFKYEGCKETSNKKFYDNEYLRLKSNNSNCLEIEHINALFNCNPDKIFVEFECGNDQLSFNENEINPKVNCICPYDLEWQTGPLESKVYSLKFMRDQLIFAEFEIVFSTTLDTVINISF
jgi:hypothetical protein